MHVYAIRSTEILMTTTITLVIAFSTAPIGNILLTCLCYVLIMAWLEVVRERNEQDT